MSPDDTASRKDTSVENAGDAIVAAMTEGGVDHLFFTSGSDICFYQEAVAKSQALGHNKPMRLVTVPLEHVSLNAALGFAAVTGRPAATAAHVDVGTLHYGGAVHTAWRTGLPVVMTAGYPPTSETGSSAVARNEGGHLWMQETYDQNGIVRNYTKWDHKLTSQDNAGTTTSRAIQMARTEPCGPVYMSIPKEVTLEEVGENGFLNAEQLGIAQPVAPNPAAIEDIAERLVNAKCPVAIVSGAGRNPDTVAPMVALCETLGIAVIESTLRAYMSFPFTHPLYQSNAILKEADVVLVLEADVPWLPNITGPAEGTYVAVVGQDPIKSRIPTYEFPASVRVVSDPLLAIQALTEAASGKIKAADKKRIAARSEELAVVAEKRRADAVAAAEAVSADNPIDPLWLSYQISQIVDDNCIVLDDTLGRTQVPEYLPSRMPGSYFKNPGSSGGWAPGAALGAKIGAPDKDIIAVTGDGFYMFGTPGPAIWAANAHNAPFMAVVYTNRSYTTGTSAVIRTYGEDGYAQKAGFEGGYFDPPIDFAKEAEACGAYGENVDDPAEVGAALKRGLDRVRNGQAAVISVWLKRLETDD